MCCSERRAGFPNRTKTQTKKSKKRTPVVLGVVHGACFGDTSGVNPHAAAVGRPTRAHCVEADPSGPAGTNTAAARRGRRSAEAGGGRRERGGLFFFFFYTSAVTLFERAARARDGTARLGPLEPVDVLQLPPRAPTSRSGFQHLADPYLVAASLQPRAAARRSVRGSSRTPTSRAPWKF